MKVKKQAGVIITEAVLWCFTLLVFIPLYFILVNSLKPMSEVSGRLTMNWPIVFSPGNYAEILKGNKMLMAFMNSFIYSGFSVLLTSLFASMAAYIIVRRKSKLNTLTFNLFLVGMIAPTNIVTCFFIMKNLHLINTYHGLILMYAATFMPFTVFLYKGFINGLPKELDEAALVDGAGPLTIFFKIIFPLLKSVTVTAMVLNFVNCWNDFMFPLYFTTESSKWGVVLTLFQYTGQFVSSKHLLFAAASLSLLPIIVVYLFGQKHIISGMVAGAIKG